MKSVVAGVVCAVGVAVLLGAGIGAQEQPRGHAGSGRSARRAQAGLKDAGQAARNLELVSSLPKPPGFFDPKMPAGEPDRARSRSQAGRQTGRQARGQASKPTPSQPEPASRRRRARSGLNFANSDLAFSGQHLFIGNFNGFNVYDLADPKKPKLLASIVCPGGQGDVSVHGNLLVMSVEQTRGRLDCGTQGVEPAVSTERFRGVRVFDITDVKKPKQVAAVQTCRGSHTHTLVTNPNDKANLYVYGSGTGTVQGRRRAVRLFGRRTRRTIRTPRSSASTSSRSRSPLPRRPASSAARASSPTRRPARSPACGRAATTDPARRRRR